MQTTICIFRVHAMMARSTSSETINWDPEMHYLTPIQHQSCSKSSILRGVEVRIENGRSGATRHRGARFRVCTCALMHRTQIHLHCHYHLRMLLSLWNSFSFMMSCAAVPTLLFQIRFTCFISADFAYNRLTSYLQRSFAGRAPSAKSWGTVLLCLLFMYNSRGVSAPRRRYI